MTVSATSDAFQTGQVHVEEFKTPLKAYQRHQCKARFTESDKRETGEEPRTHWYRKKIF